ncbi:arylesterase [Marichromatium bheemlicum]|uniref:Arylesterase n=1 Tax=Marichromatium bheemlicum TaxID=365339 RepID=A0ABX1I9V7_9GAMM|nr:arylesterase [Marichromatium bheemlicum]NKN33130.1 arylesterase [Marichromatium bheemlicum]
MIRLLLIAALSLCPPLLQAAPPTLLVLGDSLSAGYGIDREQGWVWLLEQRLERQALAYRTVNASVSGDTSAGGLTRLPALLERHHPAVVVIELGANDGLRGLSLERLRANLEALITQARTAGSRVLLLGVRLPPNYGAAYIDRFQAVFHEAAAAHDVPLVAEMLRGIAEDRTLMQPDGLHPTAAAQPRILDNVWPALRTLLVAEQP